MKCLESNSQTESGMVEARGWRWGGELYFNEDRVSPWEEEETYEGDRWWWCLYNNGNILKATDLYI